MIMALTALSFVLVVSIALITFLRRGLWQWRHNGNWIKNAAASSVFVQAEARGAFRKLPAFYRDFLGEYPGLRILEDNYQVVRDECLALLERRHDIPSVDALSAPYTSAGIHAIAWKSFMFKSGRFIDENCALAPRTAALLRQIPNVYTAFFSILDPHQHIKPHWGYWKGFVRYHLGVVIPENNRDQLCWIRINARGDAGSRAQGRDREW